MVPTVSVWCHYHQSLLHIHHQILRSLLTKHYNYDQQSVQLAQNNLTRIPLDVWESSVGRCPLTLQALIGLLELTVTFGMMPYPRISYAIYFFLCNFNIDSYMQQHVNTSTLFSHFDPAVFYFIEYPLGSPLLDVPLNLIPLVPAVEV